MKGTVSSHTSKLPTTSFSKVFNILLLNFYFFFFLNPPDVHRVLPVDPHLWGQTGVVSFIGIHICFKFCLVSSPPSPQTHHIAMDWAFLGIHHLIPICQPALPSASDIWRGILSPWGVTKQTGPLVQTIFRKNARNCMASEQALGSRSGCHCKSADKSISLHWSKQCLLKLMNYIAP